MKVKFKSDENYIFHITNKIKYFIKLIHFGSLKVILEHDRTILTCLNLQDLSGMDKRSDTLTQNVRKLRQ